MIKVALVGARGYVGFELIQLIDKHPNAQLVAAYSREYEGQKVADVVDGFSNDALCYIAEPLESLEKLDADVLFLALPNDIAGKHKQLWHKLSEKTCVIDLSSDFRFDDYWTYGQPETCAEKIKGQKLIANPGCYATASQLGLLPIVDYLETVPSIFGVSGYSGAGSKPSENNDPKRLKDNLKAYKLVNHIHENEVCRALGTEVYFMPHVAAFFRGIHLTISAQLKDALETDEIKRLYQQFYQGCALIHVTDAIPEVQAVQNTHNVNMGGFSVKGKHLVLCVTIDNLLKGASSQAIQNMNLALNLEMNLGIM